MIYELWDGARGNAIAGLRTEGEALAIVRAEIESGGRHAVQDWFLRKEDSRGRSRLLAEGQDLADRALVAAPVSTSVATR